MQKIALTEQERRDAVLSTLANLAEIYREDNNSITALDATGKHKGNTLATYCETVAQLLTLTK